MFFKVFFGLLLVGALASAGWYFRDDPQVRGWLGQTQQASNPAPGKGAASTSSAPTGAPAGLHKCVRGGKVEYTSEPCPQGSTEQTISRGAVTTVPSQGAPAQQPGQQQGQQEAKGKPPLNQAMEKLSR